jgi:pyrroline-5-carboxylate reductase
MKFKSLGFIGGGRITRILLNGFKNAEVSFDKINVYEPNVTVLNTLKADYPQIEPSNKDFSVAASSDWVFIALHPPVFMETLNIIKDSIKSDSMVISLAPKITLNKIQSALSDVPNLARLNPNAGTYVNKGYNVVCFSENADKMYKKEFLEVFEKLGEVPVVPENKIEAYAMISAMGHTYLWFQFQQLKELGLSYGLSESEVEESIAVMITGTVETLFNSGLNYNEVVDLVPVKPLAEHENTVREYYKTCLNGLYQKIKPQ